MYTHKKQTENRNKVDLNRSKLAKYKNFQPSGTTCKHISRTFQSMCPGNLGAGLSATFHIKVSAPQPAAHAVAEMLKTADLAALGWLVRAGRS